MRRSGYQPDGAAITLLNVVSPAARPAAG